MNINAKESTDLVAVRVLTPEIVFAPGGVEAILKKIEEEVRAAPTDISTPSGRAAIASLAYKVARSKTALDEMGKGLVAEWKAKANAVDAERRTIRDRLDGLKDEVRKPLTDWEDADKARIAEHETTIAAIEQARVFVEFDPSAEAIQGRITWLSTFAHNRDWQEFAKRAIEARERSATSLASMLVTAQKREAEREELERLRREQVERERREREQKIAAEAAERARREAETEAAAEAAVAAEAARKEQERVEREKAEAEQRARRAEADRVAAIEKAEADRKAAAEAAERDRLRAVEAERKRIADEQAAAAAAAAKREANKRHAAKINGKARDALVKVGITAEQATAAVVAIARGEVPHVTISY